MARTKERILSFDNSVVGRVAWHRMRSKNYYGKTNCELVEFTRNYAELMYYIKEIYAPDKIYVLMDTKKEIWRNKVQLDHYMAHSKAL